MTPFGRQAVTAGLLATHALAESAQPAESQDKWALLRDLTQARASFGLSDRDLAVLTALLSFHPTRVLTDDAALIVFPSNASLSDRAHGMAESTLRRHLAALVRAGLILRRDSPNGKRYARRGSAGMQAYGFDLRPLLVQGARIASLATEARDAAMALRALREATVIHLRDAAKLIAWGRDRIAANWDLLADRLALLQSRMRRKLDHAALSSGLHEAEQILRQLHQLTEAETTETAGYDSQNERHHQSSKTIISESESSSQESEIAVAVPALPLGIVLKAAPEIADYAPQGLHNWRDLVAAGDLVHPMLGISSQGWHRACMAMGREAAAVTMACMLQKAHRIANPGAYLQALTAKAERGAFSPGPMVMALIRTENSPSCCPV